MINKEIIYDLKNIANINGIKDQLSILTEELGETVVAISKYNRSMENGNLRLRNKDSNDYIGDLTEELIDILNASICSLYSLGYKEDYINKLMQDKASRTLKHLNIEDNDII